jgi:hypothetical protein
VCLEECLDQGEVKNVLEHLYVVCARINDLNLQRTICLRANCGDVDIWNIGDLVGGEVFGSLEDLVRNRLGGWSTIRKVIFDSKIILGSCLV